MIARIRPQAQHAMIIMQGMRQSAGKSVCCQWHRELGTVRTLTDESSVEEMSMHI